MFISAGWQKIGAYAGTQAYMEALGVPGALLPLVIAVELIGGLALLVGWQARLAAFLLGGFAVVSGVLFHEKPHHRRRHGHGGRLRRRGLLGRQPGPRRRGPPAQRRLISRVRRPST